MINPNYLKNDIPALTLSVGALILAVLISTITISGHGNGMTTQASSTPYEMANSAARAGVEMAKWQIECHGRIIRGGIPKRYHINGASFEANWDDVDLADSTAIVRSRGFSPGSTSFEYIVDLESKVKIEFLPVRKNQILAEYYTRNFPIIINTGARR
jgi:hypothetical protein